MSNTGALVHIHEPDKDWLRCFDCQQTSDMIGTESEGAEIEVRKIYVEPSTQ